MKKLISMAVAVGIITASCSGQGSTPGLPGTSTQATSKVGAGTARPMMVSMAPPAGWASTATQALSLNGADAGALDASKTLTIRVGLQMRNAAAAQQAVQSGSVMSAAEVRAQFAPTADQAATVASYLKSQGFTDIQTESNNMFVSGTATAAQVQSAFKTKLESFTLSGASVFANIQPAYVPQALSGIAAAVLGLNSVPMAAHPMARTSASNCLGTGTVGVTPPASSPVATPCSGGAYQPADWQLAYDVGGTPDGSGTTIAVMAEGNVSQVLTDLAYQRQANKLPAVSASIEQVGLASPDTAGLDEWDLDTQSSTGIAGNVKHLTVYATTSLTDSDTTLEFNRWMSDDTSQLGNASFGICEVFPYLDGSMIMGDMIFLQAAAQGQTMFSSSGDNGSGCPVAAATGTPASGPPLVSYPSTSPYVVAVGGTTLLTNPDGTYLGETGWLGSGGGISQFEYSPYWESPAQPIGTTPVGSSFRGVPDVAMNADPNFGGAAIVYINGSENFIGGTSLSSPLTMGVYARLQSSHNNALGFGAIAFYRVYATYPTATELNGGPPPTQLRGGYHDILSGSNGQYQNTPGYDYVTGLGSFDVSAMNAAIGH